ncbi:MAG: NAD-binding protein, partial [Clostridia bacterium]|nr:NAD-binding protein [Clostridia bacterium]
MNEVFNPKKIAIIGTGNIGTQFACVCSKKGYEVNLYSSKPQLFGDKLALHDGDDNSVTEVGISLVS